MKVLIVLALCVLSVANALPTIDKFIVNGELATTIRPHHVHLRIATTAAPTTFFVGSGTLISTTHVLTVAQNVQGFGVWIAQVGSLTADQLQSVNVNGFAIHPNYVPSNTQLLNNIAVLRLASTVLAPAAPIPFFGLAPGVGIAGEIVGFGIFDQTTAQQSMSSTLRVAQKTTIAQATCQTTYGFLSGADDLARNFCATGTGGANFCGGDQGAGFVSAGFLLGIASSVLDANNCGSTTPALYTSVGSYATWFTAITDGNLFTNV